MNIFYLDKSPTRFYTKNPYKDRCRLEIGSTFIFRGHYCSVTKMSYNHFAYVIQENQRTCYMHYKFYLTTQSASGRQLNKTI